MATTIPAGSTTGGPQVIGGLYNSERDYFDAGVRCMEMDPVKDVEIIFNEVATVNLASAIDYKTMVRELSRGAGADITLGSGDQFGFSVDFLRKSKETDTSIVFVYKTILKAGDEVLKTPYRLTEEAKKLAAMGPDVFKKYCGDQFVYKVSKGARAYVVVKIELGSVEKKKQVKAKFHLNFVDLVEISATLKKLRKDFQVKADVKILGYQEGGFAARINSIFGNGRGVSNCSAPDLKNCEVTIASVLDYFANEFPLQFEPYFRDNSGSGFIRLPSTSFPLLYSSQSYCKLPPTERPSGIECDEPNNLMSFDKIKESQEKNRVHLEMLNNLRIDPKNGLSKESESLLSKLEGHIQSNLGKLQNARELCFRDPWACASIVSKMKQELIELEADDLVKIKTEERIEICFETGMANEIGGFELKLTKKSKELTTFTKYDAPEFASKNCFIFSAPNLTQEPDGIEISIKRHTEIDSRKCKIRTMRKFFSGYDWDLQKINVTNFITGHKVSFKGKRLKEKMKCRYEEEADVYSKWIKLKAI
jgi:hypothetical protein